MNRRKTAFATLSVSLMIGFILASWFFSFPVSTAGYIIIGLVFLLTYLLFDRFFDQLLTTKTIISDQWLKRHTSHGEESYLITDIDKIRIKWTTKATIREMYIVLRNGSNLFINGLVDFEKFKDELIQRIGGKLTVKQTYEPIDFDHPLFYSILGFPISFVAVYLMRLAFDLDYFWIKTVLFVFSMFIAALGMYFIYARPVTKRYGGCKKISDFIFGLVLIGFAICFITVAGIAYR